MNKDKVIKVVGIFATGIGFVVTLAKGWVDEEKLNKKIKDEVSKAIADQASGES